MDKIKSKIIWFVGTLVALCGCYFLSHRNVLGGWHGMGQWPVILLIFGAVVIIFAALIFSRQVLISVPFGYMLGFVCAMLFNSDYPLYDRGEIVEIRNNAWIIWTAVLLAAIAAGILWKFLRGKAHANI